MINQLTKKVFTEENMCKEKVDFNNKNEVPDFNSSQNIVAITEDLLTEVRSEISSNKTISVPITELATLGAGVSSLLPVLRTVTQSTHIGLPGGFYRLLNDAGTGLKQSKNNFFWGFTKESKLGKFEKVNSTQSTTNTIMPINPATMMMAVALVSIEKRLNDIAKMQEQILSFLEAEKESEIEADVETLVDVINKYKYNWDNEQFINSNHKLIGDIQRTAKKNMISYQKAVSSIINSNQLIVAQSAVKTHLNNLLKKFKYYRLSLYSYSLASFIEIILSKSFEEDYINEIKKLIEKHNFTYLEIYAQSSVYLEKLTNSSIETNVMKGLGDASKVIGGFLGGVPLIKDTQVDKFLKESGDNLKDNANKIETNTVEKFTEVKNPNVTLFIDRMNDLIQIFNHTEKIYFDQDQIYLVSE